MSERVPLMAGNWKMHKTLAQARELAQGVSEAAQAAEGVEVMIAPPFTAIHAAAQAVAGGPVMLGAQNVYPAGQGSFTGEICADLLADLGVTYVIIGHSERRWILGEDDSFIRDKAAAVIKAGLRPVLCVGESLEEREAGRTAEVVQGQLAAGLEGFQAGECADLVMAYEPIWAIGTGRTASPETAQECHADIRSWLADRFNISLANSLRILYGGSVNGGNVKDLMAQPDVDGALVGGASLTVEDFSAIVRFRN